MLKTTLAAFAIVAGLAAAPALAQSQNQPVATQSQGLSVAEIDQRLTGEGFRVVEIERDDGHIEVKAFNSAGQCRELHLNRNTGAIVRNEADDDCWDDDSHRRRN